MWASSKTILYFHFCTQGREECWSSEAEMPFFNARMGHRWRLLHFSDCIQEWPKPDPEYENNEAAPVLQQLLTRNVSQFGDFKVETKKNHWKKSLMRTLIDERGWNVGISFKKVVIPAVIRSKGIKYTPGIQNLKVYLFPFTQQHSAFQSLFSNSSTCSRRHFDNNLRVHETKGNTRKYTCQASRGRCDFVKN